MKNFAICINNSGFEASLEKKKLYEFLYDEELVKQKLIKIIDESSEDYIYPEDFFIKMEIPEKIKQKLEFA
jgi:hypothetical protein